MIDLVRQLVGCKQTPGSGFLWSVPIDKDMLSLQTYDRVFQRLASTHRAVPLGIYRTVPISTMVDVIDEEMEGEGEGKSEKEKNELKEEDYHDGDSIKRFLDARVRSLGLERLDSSCEYCRVDSGVIVIFVIKLVIAKLMCITFCNNYENVHV